MAVAFGIQLMQQFEALPPYLHIQGGYAREVAARPVQAGDQTHLTGSSPVKKTIGIVVVAALAASAAGVLPVAAITLT